MSDPFGGVYKKLVIKDDKLVGACLYGDTVDGSWYFKLLREGRTISDIRDKLMFGEIATSATPATRATSKAAAMADGDEVCGCNGVTKGTICKAIKDKGLFTLDEVRKHTKASALVRLVHRPGRAAPDVHRRRRLLSATPKKKAMCGCTDASHQEVRDAIRDAAPADASPTCCAALGWRTPNGCASCRPALNYYLHQHLAEGGARTTRRSRFINERSHANIQKDGTYSVIPRMWGGETTAERAAPHRRRGRQVQDPDRQGHRRPAHRPARREEGGPARRSGRTSACPRGHAYAKALRTVKTCVGSRVVPLRHAGLARRWARTSSARCGACTRRTRSSSRSRAARATAPSPASRTSA